MVHHLLYDDEDLSCIHLQQLIPPNLLIKDEDDFPNHFWVGVLLCSVFGRQPSFKDSDELDALYDRFLLRRHVSRISRRRW